MIKFNRLMIIAVAVTLGMGACKKDDPPLPDNVLQFQASELGFAADESETSIRLSLSRATDRDIAVTLTLVDSAIAYGTEYTTTPAASAGKINVTIPKDSTGFTFKVAKASGVLLDGDEKITVKLEMVAQPVLAGTKNQLVLSFSEIIALQAAMEINGGGATYPNKVFIDLSANRQTPIERTKWDLGFYSGDEYRVILNSSVAMMAKKIDKNDLNAVVAADTTGFSTTVIFNQAEPSPAALAYIDYPDGDLTKTAIAEVSATDEENKVYIVNMGKGVGSPATDRGWKKIRVLRKGTGYILQYAAIDATSFQTLDVEKNTDHFFNYASFETGAVEVEPRKTKWDIAWTYFSNITFFGAEVPYLFQDVILQNRNVEAVKVMTTTKSYEAFAEADLTGLTFSGVQTTIGSDWRSGGGPTTSPSIRSDRFYVVKDGDGNYYKLKFTALTKSGERGYPSYECALVKKGA